MPETAIITGASGGIGSALVRAFGEAGWQTVGVDVVAQAEPEADRFYLGSVVDEALAAQIAGDLQAGGARACCLINNAARMLSKPFRETTRAEWDDVIATNLSAVFLLSQALLPVLEGGSIVNISSVHARATSRGAAVYAASKGGVSALTRGLALELADEGIRVNAIVPGAIDTAMLRGEGDADAALRSLIAATPLRRIGEPDDVAQLALFLADPRRAANITGQDFVCDGGALARLATE